MAETKTVKRTVTKNALKILKLEDIQTDPSYQRDVKPNHAKIIANFDENALGIPVVGEREDGSLWIVDGLQRLTALRKMGRKEVRAEVFASDGPEHEAGVFKLINLGRTKLSPQDEFRALLTLHDEDAWAVKETAEACGFTVLLARTAGASYKRSNKTPDDKAALQLAGPNTLLNIVRTESQGTGALAFALSTVKEAWPGDRIGVHNMILKGLATYWARKEGAVDSERLIPRLRTVTQARVLYAATQANLGGDKAGSVADQIERVSRKKVKE